ncbi:MAG: Flp family type IVb pilin [Rhodocyclaceae bacterium]|nr:Flp family type IVb pilin [Rhodocyclaceae bacterium]
MNHLVQGIGRFVREDEGVTMVEYGLIAALIAIVCIVAITAVGTNLNDVFNKVKDCLASPIGALCK